MLPECSKFERRSGAVSMFIVLNGKNSAPGPRMKNKCKTNQSKMNDNLNGFSLGMIKTWGVVSAESAIHTNCRNLVSAIEVTRSFKLHSLSKPQDPRLTLELTCLCTLQAEKARLQLEQETVVTSLGRHLRLLVRLDELHSFLEEDYPPLSTDTPRLCRL